MAERTPTDLERRLHEALRRHAVYAAGEMMWCDLCGTAWRHPPAEHHAPVCLAAPDALTKGDEG